MLTNLLAKDAMAVIQILLFIINHEFLFYMAWDFTLFLILLIKELEPVDIQMVINKFGIY